MVAVAAAKLVPVWRRAVCRGRTRRGGGRSEGKASYTGAVETVVVFENYKNSSCDISITRTAGCLVFVVIYSMPGNILQNRLGVTVAKWFLSFPDIKMVVLRRCTERRGEVCSSSSV